MLPTQKMARMMTFSRRPARASGLALALLLGLFPAIGLAAISVEGAFCRPQQAQESVPARLSDLAFSAPRLTASERNELSPLSADERRELAQTEKGLRKVGLVRRLDPAIRLAGALPKPSGNARVSFARGLVEREAGGSLAWTTSFYSPGATGIRLRISEGAIPGGRIYVYASSGEVHGPYTFENGAPAEGFWTNTVFAEEVFLEVRLGASESARLSISAIAHLEGAPQVSSSARPQSAASPETTDCFVDAACVAPGEFGHLESASRAVASLLFRDGLSFFACTGGLLMSTDNSFTPYLLTANHCFDDQSSASSLEAIFNYRNPSCGGPFPGMSSFPRTLGATLLATSATSDFTLVRLAQSPPSGSFFLGWSTEDHSRNGGTSIYRLSYPSPLIGIWPQHYSRHTISAIPTPGSCSGYAQGNFIYSKDTVGGVASGSSGAPVVLADGRVVGQLLGACGSNPQDDCDRIGNSTVDGAFAISYLQVAQWLGGGGGNPSCAPNAATLCLNGNRFRVQVTWRVASQGVGGSGTAVPLSGDTGYFWFFSSGNVELIVKALDGRGLNGFFWVFYGALSDVEYTLTVTDTVTGAVKTYFNPAGRLASVADTSAFR